MFPRLPHLSNQLFLTIIIACIVSILILWYDSSPSSFKSYSTICNSNYGKPAELTDCMTPFYSQSFMDRVGMIVAGIIFLITALIYILSKAKKS